MLLKKEYAYDHSRDSQTVSSENGNLHTLINDTESIIYQYKIDGKKGDVPKPVYISGTPGERCDYALEVIPKGQKARLYVIELKGSDLRKAISQIESTIDLFKTDINKFPGYNPEKYDLYPRVVIHRVNTHSISPSDKRRIKTRFPMFVVKTKHLEESITKPARA